MEEDNNNNNINNNNNSDDNSNNKNESKNGVDEIYVSDSKVENFPSFKEKRSIAERRGFNSNAARINTALFRAGSTPLPSPVARSSPHLTIPPGISPTEFLDSPMMLPNSYGLPSPTTGTFLMLPPLVDEGSMMACEQMSVDPNPLAPYSASQNQVSNNCNMVNGGHGDSSQILVEGQPPALDFSFPDGFSRWCAAKNTGFDFYNDMKVVNEEITNAAFNVEMPMSQSEEVSDDSILPPENDIHGEIIGQQLVLEGEQKEISHGTGITRTSEDGYNWRKYGQKQVKGSEYPRSYYKCTQPNCLVKKKVERSLDGQITEIIYNGSHNHEIPNPSRRSSALCTGEMSDIAEAGEEFNADSVWGNIQSGLRDTKHGMEWRGYDQERTSSASILTESSDPISVKRGTSLCKFETPELSSAVANNDAEKDGTSQALVPYKNDAGVDESEPKRRKKEVEMNLPPPPRSVREPKVIVQIESDVDILDDGYRWRKYGQKVVKGNPNPRSYYKCTSAGCNVRKHVERASYDLKFVLTTYEGKHYHEVPAPKNSSHITSSDVARGANISKSETHQTFASHFDRKPDFSNEFLRSTLIGNFGHDMKFGPSSSSISQLKYSSLNNTMPYSSYGLNRDSFSVPQVGSLTSMLPDFSMPPLPLNLPSSSGNFCLGGTSFNNMKPMDPVQSYLSGQQQMKEFDPGFLLRPKQEQKDDDVFYNTCIPPLDHASSSFTLPPSEEPPTDHQPPMQNFPQ